MVLQTIKIKKAKKYKAHVGISFDGDADRIIMCDEKGKIVDGDQIIAMLAKRWKSKKILKGGVVGTLMSNYGLEKFLRGQKIKFSRSKVGDRYVKEKMKKLSFNLGRAIRSYNFGKICNNRRWIACST